MRIETVNIRPFDATVYAEEGKSFRWSKFALVGLVATVLTLFVAGTAVVRAKRSSPNSSSLMQSATVTRGAMLHGGALRPGAKQAPAALVRTVLGVHARAPTTNAAETRLHGLKAANHEQVLEAQTVESAAFDKIPTVGSSQDASSWLHTGIVALGIGAAAAMVALVRNPKAGSDVWKLVNRGNRNRLGHVDESSPIWAGQSRTRAAFMAVGAMPGDKAKDAAEAAPGTFLSIQNGRFVDDRWVDGTWDFAQFKDAEGEVDYDKVIDAEMARRSILEQSPIASLNEDPVNFDTGMIPWWAWVKRFHLPAAEQANGRAAMIGYVLALLVDQLSGAGIVDQQNSFLGKVLLHVVVFGCLFIRKTDDLQKLKGLLDEATFYDKQWAQTWEGKERPSETEK